MKLLFVDKIITWLDSFDVLDELGRKIFHVEAKEDGRRLKVYDSYLHNKSVATIKEALEGFPAVEIKHGTRYVSTVSRAPMKYRELFDLGFLNWCAAGDFGKGNYAILDANDRTVATVTETYLNHETMRCLDTYPEYVLHSLTFMLAIEVQVSEAMALK